MSAMLNKEIFDKIPVRLVTDNENCVIIEYIGSQKTPLQNTGFLSGYEEKFRITKSIPKMYTIWSSSINPDVPTYEQWFHQSVRPNEWKEELIEYLYVKLKQ